MQLTATQSGVGVLLGLGTTLTINWRIQLAAYRGGTVVGGVANSGSNAASGPTSAAVTTTMPSGGRVHGGIATSQFFFPTQGGSISPADATATELAEQINTAPSAQTQIASTATSAWTLDGSTAGGGLLNSNKWVAATVVFQPVVTASRTYTIGGASVGVRNQTGYSITTGDHHGTGTTVIKPDGTSTTRRYTPYGIERGGIGPWPNNHGFLNQPTDTTGLTYLNNRYYDQLTATFVSVDPLVIQTRQPYIYGGANPTTFADPTGLDACRFGNDDCAAVQQYNDEKCIWSTSCDGPALVNAISRTMDGIGGLVFGIIDVAKQDNVKKSDGNWSPDDIEAAASSKSLSNILDTLDAATDEVKKQVRGLVGSVASRLLDDNALYERIDDEKSWWDRNAGTVYKLAGVASVVLGVVSLGSCGLCFYAGVASLAISAGTTAHACSSGDAISCGLGVASLATGGASLAAAGVGKLAGSAGTALRSTSLAQYEAGNAFRWYAAAASGERALGASVALKQSAIVLNGTSVSITVADTGGSLLSSI